LQGSGWLGTTFVAYSMGNFLWYSSNSATADATGVLTVEVRGGRAAGASLTPARIDRYGVPQPLGGTAAEAARKRYDALRGCTGLTARPGR
jgi:poly-gamma-glutamate synthesis protein (capsule biosynthesis protein)